MIPHLPPPKQDLLKLGLLVFVTAVLSSVALESVAADDSPRGAARDSAAIADSTGRSTGAPAAGPPAAAADSSARSKVAPTDSSAHSPGTPAAISPAPAADSSRLSTAIADSTAWAVRRLEELGLENVSIDRVASPTAVAFENRRYRHTAEALGHMVHDLGHPVLGFERRLGMVSAAISTEGPPDQPHFRVRYPSDADFPTPPQSRPIEPTSRGMDLVVGPLLAYEFGRITDPVQFQFQVEPRLRYNPWPGARATASLVIPVYNDFAPSSLHPDVDRLRPGLLTIEQYAWLPRVALTSGSVGMFGDNRYGISVGAARPIAQGMFLLDAQADLTGFIAFEPQGTSYSSLKQWSSFAGVTFRPPFYDCSIRFRAAQFLYGDRGEEVEFKRSMGDVDFALFGFQSGLYRVKGVRITVPIPPMVRSTRPSVRVQPIERVPFSYRTDATPVGELLTGVASREDFLRQLNGPALDANRDRYLTALTASERGTDPAEIDWVSFSGMTGFVNTPWAGVMHDRGFEVGYRHIPKAWAYDHRGINANEPYYATWGLLPHIEASLRITRIPGLRGFVEDPDNLIRTDTDHMASGRLMVLIPKPGRPGLALGAEDVEGTRRFHSTYAVTGMPFSILHVQSRISLGYAPHVFKAARYVLDGGFGAFEISPWRDVAAQVEYDSEKWNLGIGVAMYGLRLRVAALNMDSMSLGVGWYHKL